jgi:VanZ family protein
MVGLVLYTTLMPASTLPVLLVNDKTAHAIAFVALMSWFCGVFEMRFSPLVAIALVCLGILIELLQHQLAYRSAELADSLADFAGIGLGWALAAAGLQHWAAVLESLVVSDQS